MWNIDELLNKLTPYLFKIPVRYLRFQVFLRSVHIHGRNAHFGKHLLVFLCLEVQQNLAARLHLSFRVGQRIPDNCISKRLREFGIETELLIKCPVGPVEGNGLYY